MLIQLTVKLNTIRQLLCIKHHVELQLFSRLHVICGSYF